MIATATKTDINVFVSARVKLTPEQRQQLKEAWELVRQKRQAPQGQNIGGATLKTVTATAVTIDGISDITMSDLITTRESISLVLLIKLQRALGIEVITPAEILAASKDYVSYVFGS
jgi:hypothetical protein